MQHNKYHSYPAKHPSFIRRNWILVLIIILFIGNAFFAQPYDPDYLPTPGLIWWHADMHQFFVLAAIGLALLLPLYRVFRYITGHPTKARYRGMLTLLLLYVLLPVFLLFNAPFPRSYSEPVVLQAENIPVEAEPGHTYTKVSWKALFQNGYIIYESDDTGTGYTAIDRHTGSLFDNIGCTLGAM